jgi:hypothetical protein
LLHRDSIQLDEEIARIQRESQAEVERLQEARREALAREDNRRGELLRQYLAGPHDDDLRRALDMISGQKDRALFGLPGIRPERQGVTAPR